jgi:lysophospholipase L1-like esterase
MLLALLLLVVGQCQSQLRPPEVSITDKDTVGYSFVNNDENVIQNAPHLNDFYQKMYLQRTQGGRKISIVHIGDSHILADFETREIRERLQNAFGDAGRGLVFPYKLIESNGPRDYLVSTNARWSGTNCVRDQDERTNYGVSGFSAITTNKQGQITFKLRDTTSSSVKLFSKVTVFHRNNDKQFAFEVKNEDSKQSAVSLIEDDFSESFYFERPVSECTLQMNGAATQKQFWLDGLLLENELSGIVYSVIGVNGAKYSDFARSQYFARQMRELTPDLVILSFGTNEAQAASGVASLYRNMEELTEQIQAQWPTVAFLITTPADSYLRGKGDNPYLPDASAVIRKFAKNKGYAYWDLHQITGGANSAVNWKSRGLMAHDSVHFSRAGYAVQGKLLYQSLMKGYNATIK